MSNTIKNEASNPRLAIGMTDDERYEVLKERKITIVSYDKEKLSSVDEGDFNALEHIGKSGARKILRKIGEDFGIFKQGYNTQDVDFQFAFSKSNLEESISKQRGHFQNYAKMMTVFDDVIRNAIGVDVQGNRYNHPNSQLDAMYVFVSAFMNDDGVVPVLLEVKVYKHEITASLYIAVSMREIDRSRIFAYISDAISTKPYPSPTSVTINLTDFLPNVNVLSSNLLKYIPDNFLNNEQKKAKQIALSETAKYIEKKDAQRSNKSAKLKK